MDELMESAQGVIDAWKKFQIDMTLQMNFDDLREAMIELRTEVLIQRTRLAADEITERVEQP